MEWKHDYDRRALGLFDPLKPSLVEWKHVFHGTYKFTIHPLETFLGGMETGSPLALAA